MYTLLTIAVVSMIVTAINGEAPLPRRFQRIEQPAPYPPRGFRPNQPFNLPERVTAPKPVYGVPEKVDSTTESDLTTPETTTVDVPPESNQKLKEREELVENQNMGIYYIYHPDGLLQRINYATKNDVKNMAYRAELKYENVQPIIEPIYTYDPNTFELRQILL